MHIQQEQSGLKGSFFIEENGSRIAEMTFSVSDARILTILHTEVDESLRGKSIGFKLVKEAATFAGKNHYKIVAKCSFAKAVLDKKKEEFKEVL